MKKFAGNILARRTHEDGMTTAEYAVGTVGATGIAGILIWLVQQDWFKELIGNVFRNIFSSLV
ncbi:MAG: DUF4244 domain-containing protein [Actinomycetaceae bacterium]|nr:DUF4244 domain-containing protein [Actinomycetaceae bacterium]